MPAAGDDSPASLPAPHERGPWETTRWMNQENSPVATSDFWADGPVEALRLQSVLKRDVGTYGCRYSLCTQISSPLCIQLLLYLARLGES